MSPVKLAMAGLTHSHSHGNARAANVVDEVELAAIWDADSQLAWRRRVEWGEFLPDLEIAPSLDELLEREDIAAVIVESSVTENLEIARRSVAAGKHALLEKPAGTCIAEFTALHDSARERGLVVQMGYIMRYNAGFEATRDLAAAGALGDIFFVRGRISWEGSSYQRQMPDVGTLPGGMLFELGCHYLDMIITLLGKPERAHAHFGRHHDPAKRYSDSALGYLEYENAFATIETCAMESGALQNRCFEVYGTGGTVIIQPLEPPEVVVHLDQPSGEFRAGWQSARIETLPRHVKDLREFAACITGQKEPSFPPAHDLLVQETLLRMCAADTGGQVTRA